MITIFKRWRFHSKELDIDNSQNPWAGLASYEDPETAERKLKFCGRDDDSYDLARLIMGNVFVTLYGKSGIGKTSLLNAGVFPELREEKYIPINIRLGMRNEEYPLSYQAMIVETIERVVKRAETINVIDEQQNQQSIDYLWNYFARHRFYDKYEEQTTPVIVLDQFEEVFRGYRHEAETLLRQLDYLNDKDHNLDSCKVDGLPYRYEQNFRFVVSIREDDLYRLEDSIDNCYLPALKRCRYRLRSLSEEGARDAILIPGEGLFNKKDKDSITEAIVSKSRNDDGSISTNIISLLCNRIYVDFKKSGTDYISPSLVENFIKGNPFERFYSEATQGFSNKEKSYIEEHFVDSTSRRNSIPESDFLLRVKKGTKLLEGKNRILQRISTSSDGKNSRVELIHDSFCEPLLRMKIRRFQRRRILVSLLVAVMVILCGGIISYIYNQYTQNWNLQKTEARYIASQAERLIDVNDTHMAQRLLLEILPQDLVNPNRPYVVEAGNALLRAQSNYISILDKSSECTPCISDDGSFAFTASKDTIKMIDVNSGKTIQVFKGHTDNISVIELFPDNKTIASAEDNNILIWDVQDNKILARIDLNRSYSSFVINPTGKQLATICDSTITIWNPYNGNLLFSLKDNTNGVNNVVFSSDGNYLLSTGNGTITMWDANKGIKHKVIACGDEIEEAFFSSDDKHVISSLHNLSYKRYIKMWDVENQSVSKTIKRSDITIADYVYNAYNNSLICVYEDGNLEIWNLNKDSKFPQQIIKTENAIKAFCSPKSTYLAVKSYENDSIKLYNTINGELTSSFGGITSYSPSLFFSTDEKTLFVLDNYFFKVIRLDKLIRKSINDIIPDEDISVASFSQGGKYIATTTSNATIDIEDQNTIKIWDRNTKRVLFKLKGHNSVIYSLAFSQNNRFLVSTSRDATMKIWDVQNGKLLRTLKRNGTFKVLDPKTKKKITIFNDYSPVFLNAIFKNNDNEILSLSDDGIITSWNLSDGNINSSIESYNMAKGFLCFSQTGKVVSQSKDGSINIWDSTTKKLLTKCNETLPNPLNAVFSPDEKRIAILFENEKLGIWDTSNGSIQLMIDYYNTITGSHSFSKDGNQITSITIEGNIISNDIPTLQDMVLSTFDLYKNYRLNSQEKKAYYLK